MSRRFPGMDPHLEAAWIWPSFHEAFLFYVREALQPALPARYYAELRVTTGPMSGGSASPSLARATCEHVVIADHEPLRVGFLEIREVGAAGRLVTLIELLSPSNQRPGPDFDAFARKQAEVLQSEAHWMEVDLLRAGQRHAGHPSMHHRCKAKGHDYVVVVSRAERRRPKLDLEVYGFTVDQPLPVVAVPLVPPDPDVALDLDQVFVRAYDTGPYRKIIDYSQPPDPPLPQR